MIQKALHYCSERQRHAEFSRQTDIILIKTGSCVKTYLSVWFRLIEVYISFIKSNSLTAALDLFLKRIKVINARTHLLPFRWPRTKCCCHISLHSREHSFERRLQRLTLSCSEIESCSSEWRCLWSRQMSIRFYYSSLWHCPGLTSYCRRS